MTSGQSKQLKSGSRVHWMSDLKDAGTVIENTWSNVLIRWDNRGDQSIMHNDMAKVFSG